MAHTTTPMTTPVRKNWASTDVKFVDTTLIWTINNYSLYNKKVGEYMDSSHFPVENFELFLRMYPSGRTTSPDHLALYLTIKQDFPDGFMAKHQFSLINPSGATVHQLNWSKWNRHEKEDKGWGNYLFIKLKKLLDNRDTFLPNDTLRIHCAVRISAGFKNSEVNSYEPELVKYDPNQDVVNNISLKWMSGLYSDLTLIVTDRKFYVHKYILSARSTFFHELIQGITTHESGHSDILELYDFPSNIMLEVLKYIYSGKVDKFDVNLLAAAAKYRLTGLQLMCEDYFLKQINILNVSTLFLTAVVNEAKRLEAKATKFILRHAAEVIETSGYQHLKTVKGELILKIFSSQNTSNSSVPSVPPVPPVPSSQPDPKKRKV